MQSKPVRSRIVSHGFIFSLCAASYILGLLLVTSPGCNGDETNNDEQTSIEPGTNAVKADFDDFQAWLKSKKGNVVLVDYWATYCAPCLKKFPNVVALYDELKDDGLSVCSVSVDELGDNAPEKTFEKVNNKLAKFNATFDNFIATGTSTTIFEKHDLSLVPTYKIYDREGNLVKTFSEDFEFAEVEKLIRDQLSAAE